MRKGTLRLFVFVLALLLVMAAIPAALAGNDGERPFKEDLSGHIAGMVMAPDYPTPSRFDGRCSKESLWITEMEGSGTITHLGRVTWTASHCFYVTGGFGDGVLEIAGANGDQLFGSYLGEMTGPATWIDTMIVTGGTGRFAEADGRVVETGWVDMESGYMEITGEGWVSYSQGH